MTADSLMGLVTDLVTRLEAGTLDAGFSHPLRRGSARGTVSVTADPHDAHALVMVVRLEIMSVPEGRVEEFYRTLLELNHGLEGRAAFSVDESGMVHLAAGRPLEDLDPGEVVDLILWTADQADDHDDRLLERFRDP